MPFPFQDPQDPQDPEAHQESRERQVSRGWVCVPARQQPVSEQLQHTAHLESLISEWDLCVREVTWGETLRVLGCWEVPASRRRHLGVDGRVRTIQDLVLRVQAYEHP